MVDNDKGKMKLSAIPGLAVIGCLATGVLGLVNAYRNGSDLSLFAAAIAFGIVAYLSFGK